MTQRPSPATQVSDDELVRIARRYRKDSIATLITICRDVNAPASARAAASAKLLEFSDGKPGQARQITVADLATMSDDLRMQLLEALVKHYIPSGFTQMLKQACDDAVAIARLTFPKPNRFQRGPLAGAGPEVPRWPSAPPAKAISVEMSPKVEEAAYEHAPLPPAHGRQANALSSDASENVVPIKPLAPFGLKFGLAEDPPADSAPGKGNGSIHPHVVYRSTLKDPLAFDTAFFNGRTTKPV